MVLWCILMALLQLAAATCNCTEGTDVTEPYYMKVKRIADECACADTCAADPKCRFAAFKNSVCYMRNASTLSRHPKPGVALCIPDGHPAPTPSPVPPVPTPAPAPAPTTCLPGDKTCLPSWKPTWDMKRSTVLYTCNSSGMHNVSYANKYGTVVYDWSNAKALWANAHPMNSEELITKQAEMVLAADPGIDGEQPRVWAYRNTIKALNWYGSVRTKLDDPAYASWFIKFKGFQNTPYPGGKGKAQNGTLHVPHCDWYGNVNGSGPPKCSGFYHDQEQTPEHAASHGRYGPGGWPDYKVDGECIEQCDCGATNPCGEYIFDHRGGVVHGRNFTEWFVNEYMISNETLQHINPKTGKPQIINLGWLDDKMGRGGPSEEDHNFVADTGFSPDEMNDLVAAYEASMLALKKKVLPMGGFWWQLMDTHGHHLAMNKVTMAQCVTILDAYCVDDPPQWNRYTLNAIGGGGGVGKFGRLTAANLTDYTAEFLLTRGPYAMLGYTWYGCTKAGSPDPPRAKEWDMDFGVPAKPCVKQRGRGNTYRRDYEKAVVVWDCDTGHGSITMKTVWV